MAGHSERYADAMKSLNYGYGLYHPEYSDNIRIGSCGYFDSLGVWRLIRHIPDIRKDDIDGFTPLKHAARLSNSDPVDEEWEPKYAVGVKGSFLDLAVKPLPDGVPVTAQAAIKYTSSEQFGAVLLTSPPVRRTQVDRIAALRAWEQQNHEVILNEYPEVRNTGLWMIVTTWSTTECALSTWEADNSSLVMSFGVSASSIADLSLNAGSFLSSDRGGRISMKVPKDKPNTRIVVFVQSILIRYKYLTPFSLPPGVQLGAPKTVPQTEPEHPESSTGSDTEEDEDFDEEAGTPDEERSFEDKLNEQGPTPTKYTACFEKW